MLGISSNVAIITMVSRRAVSCHTHVVLLATDRMAYGTARMSVLSLPDVTFLHINFDLKEKIGAQSLE